MSVWTRLKGIILSSDQPDSSKEKEDGEATSPPASGTDQVGKAIEQIRETAKWLLTTFGAIGALLVAGTQLSDIADTEGGKLALALFGAVLALGGVAIVIWVTGRVLSPQRVGLDDITNTSNVGKWAAADPGLLKGQATTVEELSERYRTALTAYADARRKAEESPDDTALRQDAKKKWAAYRAIENPMQFIRSLAGYDRVNRVFQDALAAIAASLVFIAIGLLVFAYATGSAADDEEKKDEAAATDTFATPAAVTLAPTSEGREVLTDILGENCPPESVEALLLSSSENALDVVTSPSENCPAARFSIDQDLVAIQAQEATVAPSGG
jgi:hypothetical protein